MAAVPPVCNFNQDAQAFKLKGVDEKMYDFDGLNEVIGTKELLAQGKKYE